MSHSVLLASASPQRSAILTQLGVAYRVLVSDATEIEVGVPLDVALSNAQRKATVVVPQRRSDEIVIAVDTLVACGGSIHGKPSSADDARRMLMQLRGTTHHVVGGMVVVDPDGIDHVIHATTTVRFRAFPELLLNDYLESGEWRGRAGGYAIQGRGAAFVESIDGDYLNVVGMPVAAFLELIESLGLNLKRRTRSGG